MAARKKSEKKAVSEAMGQTDPKAPLDSKELLAAARPVLKLLAEDLLERAKASKSVTAALEARHKVEQEQRRTGDPFVLWQTNFVDQVAAAWLLSCVFVRTLEDRGLLGDARRLAGPGAADSLRQFFEMAPSLGERDYLLTVFRELSRFPAAADLFDARHNPVWLLTPSATAAKLLLGLFRLPSPEAPTFRFGQTDTHFLGDLYQDLNEDVRKRFALLQTPEFVASFVLDQTLEPAIKRFGLDETTIIDPTCGGGHFLLGAFDRLYDHRLLKEPGLAEREAANKALDAIYGSDINPYAVAIARFRLTLAFLDKAGFERLAGAPKLPLHLAVADSLLHNAQLAQASFQELEGQSAEIWAGQTYALEDEGAAREILHRRYAAVVGNPPYITVKDTILRDRYRGMYSSAFRAYSLGVPFTQRFFQLARDGGSVGMITANSFMKREFGNKLIEEYLPTVNLNLIVNTSGAEIPGHGTPTVLLFGTSEPALGTSVLAILAKRGEPTTPKQPEMGLVWRSIADHWSELGFENDYISVARVDRLTLAKHPWSLGGGGVSEIKEILEERAHQVLKDLGVDIGTGSVTREDDVFLLDEATLARWRIPKVFRRASVVGETVRDWSISNAEEALWPYSAETLAPVEHALVLKALWPWRTQLAKRVAFGKTQHERGLPWYGYSMFFADRARTPLTIAFAFVATHNHFVLDHGGKVFNRTAPIIKLPERATEEDHLKLLAYLNSSTACFWMKQVFFPKTSGTNVGDVRGQEHRIAYEFGGTGMYDLPLPMLPPRLADYARSMVAVATHRSSIAPERLLDREFESVEEIRKAVKEASERDNLDFKRLVFLQEELDWIVYELFGLTDANQCRPIETFPPSYGMMPNDRPFISEQPASVADPVWTTRLAAARKMPLAMLETALHKRPWFGVQGVFHRDGWTYEERSLEAARSLIGRFIEAHFARHGTLPTTHSALIAVVISNPTLSAIATFVAESVDVEARQLLARFLDHEAVPFLAAWRYTASGLEKRDSWEQTWNLQRREDFAPRVDTIPIPPKYDPKDFLDQNYHRLRGKLDVPKERFISYPGCESDHDHEPVYGWAGWNHLQQAQALSALYQNRKQEEAWGKDRLTPMLAGLLELIPWIKQWHNEPSDEYGGLRLGEFFDSFLDGECRGLGLTRDDLRAWRPEAKKRGKAAAARRTKTSPEDAEESAGED